jgi:hypothetical protein
MRFRSNSAKAAKTVTRSLSTAFVVSTDDPAKSRMRSATPFLSRRSTILRRSWVDRARRSSRVTTKVSPSRANPIAASSCSRFPTDETCSEKVRSQPMAFRASCCAIRPAFCRPCLSVNSQPAFLGPTPMNSQTLCHRCCQKAKLGRVSWSGADHEV